MFNKETNNNEKLIVGKYVSWYIWYYRINSLKVLDKFEMLLISFLFFFDSYRGINNQLLLFRILLFKYKKAL